MATKQKEKTRQTPPRQRQPEPGHGQGGSPRSHEIFRLLDGARYAAPWIVGLMIIPGLSVGGRFLWGGNDLLKAVASVLLVTISGVLIYAVWDESAPRSNRWDRLRVAISTGWVFGAAVGTAWLGGPGPWSIHRPWADILWGIGCVLSLWWTLGALPAVAGRGHDGHGRDTLAEKLGLGVGTDITDVRTDAGGIRKTFTFRLKGCSVEALQSAVPLLASRLQVPATGVRVVENPDDAGAPSLVVMAKDVLKKMGQWPGPLNPGGSIAEPVLSAMRECGSLVTAIRLYRHLLIGGMTGAGKTEGAIGELLDIITRRDVVVVWSDTGKPGHTLPDIAPAMTKVVVDRPGTVKMVNALQKAVTYRASRASGRKWKPTKSLPAILVHFEEGALVASILGTDLRDFVATARSVGIIVTLSMQRPSANALDTDVRAQFADRWCFGVSRSEDTDMVLTEGMTEKGVAPEKWADKKPGYCYREAGPEVDHATPARTWLIPPNVVKAHVAEWAPKMATLDKGTADAMGQAWAELTSGEAYALANGWTKDRRGNWVPPVDLDLDEDEEVAQVDEVVTQAATTPPVLANPAWGSPAQDEGAQVETEDDEMSEHLTAQERAEIEADVEQLRNEVVEALGPIDPEIAEAVRQSDAGVDVHKDGEDFELWTGDGTPLTYEGRVLAVADELAQRLEGHSEGVFIKVEDLAEAMAEVPGWHTGQAPACYRLLGKAEAAGEAEHKGRGAWWISPTCPGWLRREVARIEATEGEDDE